MARELVFSLIWVIISFLLPSAAVSLIHRRPSWAGHSRLRTCWVTTRRYWGHRRILTQCSKSVIINTLTHPLSSEIPLNIKLLSRHHICAIFLHPCPLSKLLLDPYLRRLKYSWIILWIFKLVIIRSLYILQYIKIFAWPFQIPC